MLVFVVINWSVDEDVFFWGYCCFVSFGFLEYWFEMCRGWGGKLIKKKVKCLKWN